VGRDQIQHIEMARDIAARFNHLYGEHLTLPEAAIEEHVATLPGTDGRKMSKSYDNTIPLFASAAALKKAVLGIVTDSRLPGEPKDADSSNVFQLYRAFASREETAAMRAALEEGIGWGEAKQRLFERIDAELAPQRARYEALIADPAAIEAILLQGAAKARALAMPLLASLRHAVGLRPLLQVALAGEGRVEVAAVAEMQVIRPPVFKQYRDADGLFYFKLLAHDGKLLLQSLSHTSPKDAGARIAAIKRDGAAALSHAAGEGVRLADEVIGHLAEDVALDELLAAVAAFAESAG
jgi:tryptophanyl-tRNA synthetase